MNTHDEIKELAAEFTTDQFMELVESLDPDWIEHFGGDLDRAVAVYIEFGWPESHAEVRRIAEEAREIN